MEPYPESEDPSDASALETNRPALYDDKPTPPIDVPNPFGDGTDRRRITARREPSDSLENFLRRRRPSITFAPEVKLDTGDQTALEAPLPKLTIKTRPRGRSLLEAMAKPLKERAHSEADREDFNQETGERLEDEKRKYRDIKYHTGEPRWPLLQTTVNELAQTDSSDFEGGVSLTSRTTASPLEEIRTPETSAQLDTLIFPLSISSPKEFETLSFVDGKRVPRSISAASRSRSFAVERQSSRRRGTSRRSTSNSASPASAFLSRYLPAPLIPDPDAEGQEVGDYVLGREIGFGGFSTIKEAYTLSGDTRILQAVKIVRKQVQGKEEAENERLQSEFEHEVDIWRCLQHKHILPLISVFISDFATFAFTQLNTGGTLFDAVRNNRSGLSPKLVRRYCYQLASALRYLHEDMHLIHHDVKLENCLLDMTGPTAAEEGGTLLLCDFGLADYMNSEHNSSPGSSSDGSDPRASGHTRDENNRPGSSHILGPSDTSTSIAGSLPYAAPEMLENGMSMLDFKIDIWAFGVVVFAIATGNLPFMHAFTPRVRLMILSGEWDREQLQKVEHGVDNEIAAVNGVDGAVDNRVDHEIGDNNATPNDINGTNGVPKQYAGSMEISPLDGVFDFVDCCLQMEPWRRWDIKQCLESRWLIPENDIQGESEDEERVWGNGPE